MPVKKSIAKGRLNPALLSFNDAVRNQNVVPMVRRWVASHRFQSRPHDPQDVAQKIVSEARVRIIRYQDDPLTALSLSAVLNTIIYRDNSVLFNPLVERARQSFAARL